MLITHQENMIVNVKFKINDSPAFELLQLAVVQHAPHVLVHLLQTHIEKIKLFF